MLRQIIQPRTNHEIPVRKDGMAVLRARLFKSLAFLGLAAIIGGGSLDDGFRFLFLINKSDISDYESTISRSELWHMNQGTWCLIAIGAGIIITTSTAIKMFQLSRESPEKDPRDHE